MNWMTYAWRLTRRSSSVTSPEVISKNVSSFEVIKERNVIYSKSTAQLSHYLFSIQHNFFPEMIKSIRHPDVPAKAVFSNDSLSKVVHLSCQLSMALAKQLWTHT